MFELKKIAIVLCLFALSSCGSKQSSNTNNKESGSVSAASSTSAGKKTILVFGDSLTAGYGLDDVSESFPGVIKTIIDSLKLPYNVINSGVSGETSAGGKSRIDWVLKQKPDVFLLELGANDGLRGNSVEETRNNLQYIINRVKAKYPAAKIILLGMQVPPSMGQKYAGDFKQLFPQLATKNNIGLVPFLLQGVGGDPKLNQGDGIHPNPAGAKIVADNVWKQLRPIL